MRLLISKTGSFFYLIEYGFSAIIGFNQYIYKRYPLFFLIRRTAYISIIINTQLYIVSDANYFNLFYTVLCFA